MIEECAKEAIKEIIISKLRRLIYYPRCPKCGGICINKGVEKLTEDDWEKIFYLPKEKIAQNQQDDFCEKDRLKGEFECRKCGKVFKVEIIPKYS